MLNAPKDSAIKVASINNYIEYESVPKKKRGPQKNKNRLANTIGEGITKKRPKMNASSAKPNSHKNR